MKAVHTLQRSSWSWLILLIILVIINVLASFIHARIDLTSEKRYTLSDATTQLTRNLQGKVEIDVFLKGEFNSGFKKLANSTNEFLQLLKDQNSGAISYQFISPQENIPGSELKFGDSLARMGAVPINLTVQKEAGQSSNIIFPVAVMRYNNKQVLVNLYPGANSRISQDEINNAEAVMEYQFANALNKLSIEKRPAIAYAMGNGEPVDQRTYDLRQTISSDYDFGIVDMQQQTFIPQAVDLLLIVKPKTPFSEEQKLKIDQFVMRGGKLLCFIDNLNAEQDSLNYSKGETIAYDRNLNLTDLFFKYGLRINTDLIMDLQCDMLQFIVGGTPENPQTEYLHWNYYPFLTTPNKKVSNSGYVSGKFVNSIDTIAVAGIQKTVLLATSPNSRTISTPARISLNENRNAPQDAMFNKNAVAAAMLLEGKFNSLYRNRATQAQRDSLKTRGLDFIGESKIDNKIVVVADGDIVFNDFLPPFNGDDRPTPLPMGWNKFTYFDYVQQKDGGRYFIPTANREFFLNTIEYLINNPAISETRNKEIVLRLLDSQKVKESANTWKIINIAIPIILVIITGLFYQQLRKRKYSRNIGK